MKLKIKNKYLAGILGAAILTTGFLAFVGLFLSLATPPGLLLTIAVNFTVIGCMLSGYAYFQPYGIFSDPVDHALSNTSRISAESTTRAAASVPQVSSRRLSENPITIRESVRQALSEGDDPVDLKGLLSA